ncbi:hypothetical protein RHS03_07957, partial [Rhizoctonia solani]
MRELRLYERRLGDLSEREVRQRLWEGVHQYIRLKWAEDGHNPEDSSLSKMIKKALRYERAHEMITEESKKLKTDYTTSQLSRPDRARNSRTRSRPAEQAGEDRRETRTNRPKERGIESKSERSEKSARPVQGSKSKSATQGAERRLSPEEKEQHRAEGRCYTCGVAGHRSRDCPKKNQAKRPKISSSALRLKAMDDLASAVVRLECNAAKVKTTKIVKAQTTKAIERNASVVRDVSRVVPKTIVVEVLINGKTANAMLDTGSQADLMSSTLAEQLKLPKSKLGTPLCLQMAVTGSKSSINYCTTVELQYQGIRSQRTFDIANIDSYDLVLGMTFLQEHQVTIRVSPPGIAIGSVTPIPLKPGNNTVVVRSAAAEILEENLEALREEMRKKAEDLCKTAGETSLPPMRVINHRIPIIDESKQYSRRGSRVAEALRPLWIEKHRSYTNTGRWRHSTGTNATPMLCIPKRNKDGKTALRTVFDLRERNANTRKLSSPLPEIDDILNDVLRHPYRSLLDGKDAYEQIRVEPDDVKHTVFVSPSGTMESMVMQQGNCNAGATYQTLMQAIFGKYVGKFMHVYLDDIAIFSDTIHEHVEHIEKVLDVLREQKLYLSPGKMQFFADELRILGHVIDRDGIRMDPDKVDSIEKWKTPTNKDLLMSFIGAVGYLAPNCPGIRIPMGMLSKRTTQTPWYWGPSDQRAFQEVKDIVSKWRAHHRVALNYSPDADPIYLVTDASFTGASGFVCQGKTLESARIAAFWSGKLKPAQQNYPVHEQELLAIVESLKRFKNLLHGVRFTVKTDHRGLTFLMSQKGTSPRQARWFDTLSQFDFEIEYIPGETNTFADALSRIYSNEHKGVQRAGSEYVSDVDTEEETEAVGVAASVITQPVEAGPEAAVGAGEFVDIHAPVLRRSTRARRAPTRLDQSGAEKRTSTKKAGKTNRTAENTESKKQQQPEVATGTLNQPEQAGEQPTAEREDTSGDEGPSYGAFAKAMIELDVEELVRGKYGEDNFFSLILRDPSSFPKFENTHDLILLNDRERKLLCIPDVRTGERKLRERIIDHAHLSLAHLGHKKTYAYMRESVWWKGMHKDVQDFCTSCVECAAAKTKTTAPYGKLMPLTVPTRPWQVIGFDMVGPLPLSKNRDAEFDMVGVVVDLLTMMTHLMPMRQTYKARDLAELLFNYVYKLHGMPEAIVSDRDSLFTSQLWTGLHEMTGTSLRMSSAYHPQSDGTVERANRTWVSLLRVCIDGAQKNWAKKLPGIEFAINQARAEATGLSPFYLNYGVTPRPMIWRGESPYPGVRVTLQRIKDGLLAAHDAVEITCTY